MCRSKHFVLIEKTKRFMKALTPNDLHKVTSTKYDPLYQIIDMSVNGFWNIQEPTYTYLNTKNFNVSEAIIIKFGCNNPIFLLMKGIFSDIEEWKSVNILEKRKTIENLKYGKLTHLFPKITFP